MSTLTRYGIIAVAAVVLSFSCETVQAQTGSAEKGALSDTPIGKIAGGLNPTNWKVPKFSLAGFKSKVLPTNQEKQRMAQKKDSLFSEVGQTARQSWTRTKNVLNPKRLIPTNFMGGGDKTSKKASEPKKGFFSSMFSPSSEPAKASTVTDFLKQDRVR